MAEEKKGFFGEFKTFIARGNAVDMAVGIIVGGLFTSVVQSLVKDVLNPLLGFLIGGVDFTDLRIILKAATDTSEEVAIRYGNLIQSVIQFVLTAFVLFLIVRALNKLSETKEVAKKIVTKVKKEG